MLTKELSHAEALALIQRIDPQFKPVWDKLSEDEQVALARVCRHLSLFGRPFGQPFGQLPREMVLPVGLLRVMGLDGRRDLSCGESVGRRRCANCT